MLKAEKIKKGLYSLLEDGEVVGEVSENFVGRYGEASYRWRGSCNGRQIHGSTMTEAIRMVYPKWSRHEAPETVEELRRQRDKYKSLSENLGKRIAAVQLIASGMMDASECSHVQGTRNLYSIGKRLRRHCFGYEADGKTKL